MKHVFLSAPYAHNAANVVFAIDMAEKIQDEIPDVVVFVPHLYHFWGFLYPDHDEKFWLGMCLKWLSKCDALYRMPGISAGANMEEAEARELGIPIFYDMDKLIEWSEK